MNTNEARSCDAGCFEGLVLSSACWCRQMALLARITRAMNNVLMLPICNSETVAGVIDSKM